MFVKKHFFNYPISKGSVKVGTFKLEGFDEVMTDGVLLIEKRDEHYNFYLPSLEATDSLDVNILCIFSNIEEYVYENELLFIKKEHNGKFIFIVIEPNSFCWHLTEENLPEKLESAPKIPCMKDSEVTFFDFDFFHGIFIEIDKINYFINFNNGRLGVKKIEGFLEPSKIFNTVIVVSKFPNFKYFFEDGIKSTTFSAIKQFDSNFYPYIAPKHYTGYLCYNDLGQIKALRIGMDIPNSSDFDYSYSVEFDKPLREIKFLNRDVKSYVDGILPRYAVDIWAIETIDSEKKYFLQEIGENPFSKVVDKI